MIVIRTSRSRLLLLFGGSLLFVAAGIWLFTGPGIHWMGSRDLARVLGASGAVFFALCGGVALRRLAGHRVALVIDRRGVIDNASATPAGRLAWEQISRVGVAEVLGQRFVGIDVRDPEKVLGKVRTPKKLHGGNRVITGYLINLPEMTLDRPASEVSGLLERYLRDPRAREELEEADTLDRSGTGSLE